MRACDRLVGYLPRQLQKSRRYQQIYAPGNTGDVIYWGKHIDQTYDKVGERYSMFVFSLSRMEKPSNLFAQRTTNKTPLPTRPQTFFFLQFSNSRRSCFLPIFFFSKRISKLKLHIESKLNKEARSTMSGILKRLGDHFGRSLRLATPSTTTSTTKTSDAALFSSVWQSVILKEDRIIDWKKRRVGNKDGLGLLERLDRIENILDQLARDSKMHKTINDQFTKERKAQNESQVLYRTAQPACVTSRNKDIIHPGNILDDIEVMEWGKKEHPWRYENACKGFESMYFVSMQYKDQILAAPELIIKTFNILGTMSSRWGWCSPCLEGEAQRSCRIIIGKWLEYINTAGAEYPEDEIKREFEILSLFKKSK